VAISTIVLWWGVAVSLNKHNNYRHLSRYTGVVEIDAYQQHQAHNGLLSTAEQIPASLAEPTKNNNETIG
jgi:hypothetical protein